MDISQYKLYFLVLHIIGVALGAGGATVTDTLFFKFLKDYKISAGEREVMKTLSIIIWGGYALLILSGIGLYLPNADTLLQAPKFILKLIVVAVIGLNGVLLNLYITPHMLELNFIVPMSNFKRIAFASGAISMVSWYSALVLGIVPKDVPYSLPVLLALYLGILAAAIAGSQVVAYLLDKKAHS